MSGTPPVARSRRHRDSPRVRRLARDAGVDLDRVRRTGRHGRATPADVLEHSDQSLTQSRKVTEPITPSGQLMTVVEVDLTRVSRTAARAAPLVVVAAAAVRALGSHPVVNGRLGAQTGTLARPAAFGLGVVVDTDGGPLVPVVADARDLSVDGLSRRVAELSERARDGVLTATEQSGATLTVVDTGSRGALFDTPVLQPGQSAVLGLGAVVRRPAVVVDAAGQEQLAIRSMAHLTLTYDHRVFGGADAARYLASVKDVLETWDDGAQGAGSTPEGPAESMDSRPR